MTNPQWMSVTITIPVFATPPALLVKCLRSVADARSRGDEVFVVVDGPQSRDLDDVISHAETFGFEVVRQRTRIGLVANWNACLRLGSCEFAHVMHADDAIAPEFYAAVREAFEGEHVSVVAAGHPRAADPTRRPLSRQARARPVVITRGNDAVTYLLSSEKPATGSFVLRRSALGSPARGFDARFPYCPDEELFLSVVGSGDLALVDPILYFESRHEDQARFSTWRRSDFGDVYYAARTQGARAGSPGAERIAVRQSSRRLLSVGRSLCRAGDRHAGFAILRSIASHDRHCMLNWRYWALLILAIVARTRDRHLPSPIARPSIHGSTNEPI